MKQDYSRRPDFKKGWVLGSSVRKTGLYALLVVLRLSGYGPGF